MDYSTTKDQWLVDKIKEIVTTHKGRYGYRRIQALLKSSKGIIVNHKRLLRLMRAHNLLCHKFKNKSRRRYSSYKGQIGTVAPNAVNRNFQSKGFNQLWVTDVTEFSLPIQVKKLYLSTIMDCYNSEIIAYRMSHSPTLDIAIKPFSEALNEHRNHLDELVIHSVQGFHYQHRQWKTMVEAVGATMSMSRKGNWLDHSPMENFFSILKQETFYGEFFKSYKALEIAIHEYIRYYNKQRIKLKLKGMSPKQFRKHTLKSA